MLRNNKNHNNFILNACQNVILGIILHTWGNLFEICFISDKMFTRLAHVSKKLKVSSIVPHSLAMLMKPNKYPGSIDPLIGHLCFPAYIMSYKGIKRYTINFYRTIQ